MEFSYFIPSGETLPLGVALTRGNAKAWVQSDGNLVLYFRGKAIWGTGPLGGQGLHMQPDGNLVLMKGHEVVWTSRTAGHPHAQLNLMPDGNLVLYVPAGGGKWSPIWDALHHKSSEGLPKPEKHVFPDPMKVLKQVGHVASDVVHLKAQRAVKDLGRGVNQITGSQIIQAAFPVAAPANILNGAVTGGKSGALKAARSFLKNPIAKATYSAVGLVFPPAAPISAAAVAGMEAASRVLDGIESGDPKAVAAGALQFASTEALAGAKIPGAQRALDTITKVAKARDVVTDIMKGDPHAVAAAADLKKKAASGDKKAQEAHHVLSAVLVRHSFAKKLPPVQHAAQKESPTLMAQVHAAMNSPQGLRLGKFAVLRTGRVLYNGKGIPHKAHHKTAAHK